MGPFSEGKMIENNDKENEIFFSEREEFFLLYSLKVI